MRILSAFFRRFCPGLVVLGLPLLCNGADKPENVVLQYHFLGASKLAEGPNVETAKQAFALETSVRFKNLVLVKLATNFAGSVHFPVNPQAASLIRPLLDDLLRAESIASVGGPPGAPVNYVLAVHLSAARMEAWQQNLKTASHAPGEALQVETFAGWQWNKGSNDSFWMVPARDWLVLGRGTALASVRSDYLQQIQKSGRPSPELDFNCFEADVDWPRLANWLPLASCPLKLGRTQVAISAEKGSFHMTCQVTYPQPIQWQSQPWHIATNMVRQPLVSFTTGQDVEPFLKSDETLARFATNPLRDQFYFWSMGEMPFQSYMAWPVTDGSNTMRELSTQVLPAFNPKLKALNGTELKWNPDRAEIVWTKMPLTVPHLHPVRARDSQFLVAGLFAMSKGTGPVADALWQQFMGRSDLVYYDWELTGPRILELRTLTQMVPILQALGVGPVEPFTPSPKPLKAGARPRLHAEDQWLAGLTSLLHNTVTEVTKTGPAELTVIRNSPFVFSSLELVLLSHWLSGTPAGPLDMSLLPQATMSGPGVPSH